VQAHRATHWPTVLQLRLVSKKLSQLQSVSCRPETSLSSNTLNAAVQCKYMHLQQTSEVVPAKIRICQAVW